MRRAVRLQLPAGHHGDARVHVARFLGKAVHRTVEPRGPRRTEQMLRRQTRGCCVEAALNRWWKPASAVSTDPARPAWAMASARRGRRRVFFRTGRESGGQKPGRSVGRPPDLRANVQPTGEGRHPEGPPRSLRQRLRGDAPQPSPRAELMMQSLVRRRPVRGRRELRREPEHPPPERLRPADHFQHREIPVQEPHHRDRHRRNRVSPTNLSPTPPRRNPQPCPPVSTRPLSFPARPHLVDRPRAAPCPTSSTSPSTSSRRSPA